MAQQNIRLNMEVTADVSKAKAAITSLQTSLQNIAKMPAGQNALFNDTGLKKASEAATELQLHLQKAINVDTGKLDLSRFAASLKTSGANLNSLVGNITAIGTQGQQAFVQLAQAMANAEAPAVRLNGFLGTALNSLVQSAKWQTSAAVYRNIVGAVQSAYGYAQDLNESLNSIRIVTGQSADQMADFAKQANKAAQSLSATTTAYTDAALIFYQQGLSGKDVTDRTDTVIKLSNVTGEAAEDVSSYMTAIWNNFYDGSESLEHYADVITALGAATASSSEEIAEGLEKFASAGETVGLSYDYATSALATVVAQTRQSADTVGTAFKTIFARLQDLELGNDVEDGTTLGQYSQALETIGVNIKTASGELKDMDTILSEMGDKWTSLSKDVQVATAQAVAGKQKDLYKVLCSL